MRFCWTGIGAARHYARVFGLLALLTCWFTGAPALAAGAIERIEVRHDRVVVRFSERVATASSFVVDAPRRIALDIDGVRGGGGTAAPDGAVAAVRQAARAGGGLRIVFDLERPTIVTSGRFDGDGRNLTLRLASVDEVRFASAAAAGRQRFGGAASGSVTVAVPSARRTLPLPAIYGDDSRPLVVIDAGHGGHDPGAIGPGGLREKDVTLAIARRIRDTLVRSGRVRVALTREGDRFLALQERYGVARRLGGDLFISLHCDSIGEGMATGATVYTLSEVASDKEAARLAARENKADLLAGVDLTDANADVSSILIDLTRRETMNRSATFARLLGREASSLVPFKANFHRMASLMVLKAPDMPSILFETGYISNPTDAAFLSSAAGQQRIADGIRRAVEIHFARRLVTRDDDRRGG